MALSRTQIPVPLTAGLESREDPKLVPNPALLVRENALFKGESAFTPRHGYKALADVSNLGQAIDLGLGKAGALATFRDELLLAAAGNVFSYEASRNDWSNKGRLRAWSVHSEQVYADSYEQSFGDCATNSGVTVYAYESTQGGLYATVVDEASGTRIVSSKLISATGSKPKVLAVGPWLYVLFTYTTGGNKYVYFSRLNIATPSTISAAAVLLIDGLVSGTPYWGAVTIGQNFAVVYNNASTTHVVLQIISTDGTLGDGDTLPAPVDVSGASFDGTLTALNLACHQDRYLYVLVGTSDPDARVAVYDSDLSVTRALSTIGTPSGSVVQITASEVSATLPTMRVVYEATASVTYKHLTYSAQVRFNGTVIGHGVLARGMGLASEAWTHEGHAFVALTYDSGSALGQWQTQVILVDTATGLGACPQVGRTLRGSSAGLIGSPRLPSMMKLADGKWAFCSTYRPRGLVTRAGQSPFSPKAVARVTIDGSDERPRAVQLGQQALWAGGSPTGYDGGIAFEQGFPIVPEALTADYGAIKLEVTIRSKGPSPFLISQTVRLTPPADDAPGTTGVLTPKSSGAKIYPGEYVLVFDSDYTGSLPLALAIWFTVDGVGSAPSSFPVASSAEGFRMVQVDLLSTDNQREVCRKIATATNLGRVVTPPPVDIEASLHDAAGVYWVELKTDGVTPPIQSPLSSEQFGWATVQTGDAGTPNRVRLTCPAGRWISSGQWFQLSSSYHDSTSSPAIDENTTVLFYFTVDGVTPSTVPTSPTAFASAPIAILSTDTAYQVAGKVAAAVAGYQRSSKSLWDTTRTGPCVLTSCVVGVGTYAGQYGVVDVLQVRNNNVGGSVRPGSYVYWAVYEWVDAQGEYHVSGVSLPFLALVASVDDKDSPDAGGGNLTQTSLKLTVTTLRLTLKGQVQIGLFRTNSLGQTARRIATLANDSTVDTLTFLDTFADTDIQAAEPIYTAGGEVDHNPPQSCDVLTSWQGRMVLGSLDDPNSVAYSLPQAQGYGMAFSDLFTLRTDGVGGRITALAVLDERLVIFKASRIFVVSGELPNVQGVGGSALTPQLLAADVGCISPESVVLTPSGLLFQSAKGIYLLDRSFSVQYLGAPVERALGSRRITGAVMLPDVAQVRMTTADGDALVLDYLPGELAWGTWTGHQAQHAALWQSRFVHLRSDGRVMREEPGVYTDDGKPYQARARTAWLHMDGLVQGFQRVYRLLLLGTFKGAHKLIFKAFYDFQDVDQAQLVYDARVLAGHVFGSSSPYGAGSPFGDVAESRTYQVRAHLPRQKCEAVSFEIVIDAPGVEGAQVSQLQLELGVKAGAYKLPAARTV